MERTWFGDWVTKGTGSQTYGASGASEVPLMAFWRREGVLVGRLQRGVERGDRIATLIACMVELIYLAKQQVSMTGSWLSG
jgi:hypothetical protein